MSDEAAARPLWRDYLELTKPTVVALMIITSMVGMFLAVPEMVRWDLFILGNIGIAFCAGSAAAVNHLVDQRIDTQMKRTQNRPVAQGRINTLHASIFAATLGLVGMAILLIWVNALTAWLTMFSLLGYAMLYTLYLKRATPQNIVIGGLPGALPPLLGWVAITGDVHPYSLLLALIIFVWTPPHFWALAIHRRDDYAKAGLPMLPVTHGIEYTKKQIVLYTVLLIAISLLPFVTGMLGWLYLVGALILGFGFLYYSILLLRGDDKIAAMQTFKYSSVYLLTLFVVMLLDHYLVAKPVIGVMYEL